MKGEFVHTACYVLATAYILLAIGAGYLCGRTVRSATAGLVSGAVALIFVAALVGLNHDQVAAIWQVLVAGVACFFLCAGTIAYVG